MINYNGLCDRKVFGVEYEFVDLPTDIPFFMGSDIFNSLIIYSNISIVSRYCSIEDNG